jgi:hypothetical protein
MAYKDLDQQRTYQRRWLAAKRQQTRQTAPEPSPIQTATMTMAPVQSEKNTPP